MHLTHAPTPPRSPDGALERAVDATGGRLAALGLGLGSRLRRARVFHPRGVALRSTLSVAPRRPVGAAVLDEPEEHDCLVRLSRGVGLPGSVPDVLGVAIRLPGPPSQDLLFATVLAEDGAGRHLLAAARSFAERPLATLFPYQTSVGRVHLQLRPVHDGGSPPASPEAAASAMGAGALSFELRVRSGEQATTVGRLAGGDPLPAAEGAALRFNPFRAAEDLRPVGLLNALRHRAYASSQAARPDA